MNPVTIGIVCRFEPASNGRRWQRNLVVEYAGTADVYENLRMPWTWWARTYASQAWARIKRAVKR